MALVLTQPDRHAGRGMRPAASAVKRLAIDRGLRLSQPYTLKDEFVLEELAAARPEVLVVAAYGLILPPDALAIAPRGAFNIHASLLPRWRGAAPIQRALLAGDRETGITIMQMDSGLDTGAVLAQRRMQIAPDDDGQTLHDRLAVLGASMMVAALADVAAGRAHFSPQQAAGVTYARKLGKGDRVLDWSRPCQELERRVRALRPAPGAQSSLRGEIIKLWRARCVARAGVPGTVMETGSEGVLIACGEGALLAAELQRAGGIRLAAAEFLRGVPVVCGERLGTAR